MDEANLRHELCRAAHQLWQRSLLAGDAGMLSVEWYRRRYLATPPATRRAELTSDALVVVDLGGAGVEANGSLDESTWRPHRVAYQSGSALADPDVARPIRATLLLQPPEVWARFRRLTEGATLCMGEHAAPVIDWDDDLTLQQTLQQYPAVILPQRGLLITAASLAEALNSVEQIEHAARIERLSGRYGKPPGG